MLDKYELKELLRFLEDATEAELRKRQKRYRDALAIVTSDDVIADMKFRLRLVEEELCVRLDIQRAREIAAKKLAAATKVRFVTRERK